MALFESYERREKQILAVLKEYGMNSIEEAAEVTKAAGLEDVYKRQMVSCPFGAISDKSQIFQLAHALKEGKQIIAEVAPAFVGQFGPDVTPRKLKAALQELGFADVYEVALGADIGAVAEAHHYAEKVSTGELPFLLTSCCPSWSMLAKKFFPDMIENISQELTCLLYTSLIIWALILKCSKEIGAV